jgi:hypothetical protein
MKKKISNYFQKKGPPLHFSKIFFFKIWTKLTNQTESQKSFIKATSPITVIQSPQPPLQPPPSSPQSQQKKLFVVRPHPPLIHIFNYPMITLQQI